METEETPEKKLKPRDYVKLGVSFVVGSGTYAITSSIIKENVAPGSTAYQQVKLVVGAAVLSMMVADAATKYTDAAIDRVADKWNEAKEKLKEAKSKPEEITE